jgi:hypothetical protein
MALLLLSDTKMKHSNFLILLLESRRSIAVSNPSKRIELWQGLAVNFKNAGNGGLFNVFEVPQLEKGWKMENRKCTR